MTENRPAGPGATATTLERELDRRDAELVLLIAERATVARRLAQARALSGGTRFAHEGEVALVRRFGELGPIGAELGVMLLRLARGRVV